jgi:hypothetical protein
MKPPSEVHVESIVGRKVRDLSGRVVGRLEEFIVDDRDGVRDVKEFHIGQYAMFERLMGGAVGRSLLRFLGGRLRRGLVVPWDAMDLRDPRVPRITRPLDELREARDQGAKRIAMT